MKKSVSYSNNSYPAAVDVDTIIHGAHVAQSQTSPLSTIREDYKIDPTLYLFAQAAITSFIQGILLTL